MTKQPSRVHLRIPGPRTVPFVGLLPSFVRDPLRVLERVADRYGPKAWLPLGRVRFLLLTHPAFTHEVLVKQNRKLVKSRGLTAGRRIFGNGLFTSEGELWQKQRQAIQAAFDTMSVGAFEHVTLATARRLSQWREGAELDMCHELKQLSLDVLLASIFGIASAEYDPAMWHALDVIIRHVDRRIRSRVHLPDTWPTPANRRYERAACMLERSVFTLIANQGGRGTDRPSLLTSIVNASASYPMSDQQIRDETLTLFIAGHEATANALAWMLYSVASNPHVAARARREIGSVVGTSPVARESVRDLHYLRAIVHESLRLYPPSWAMVRRAVEPLTVDGDVFPANTEVIISQWAIHRHPRFFHAPLVFDPDRWLDGRQNDILPLAFFPFGAGPRQCIGRDFATESMIVVLAALLQRFLFSLVSDRKPVPEVALTLRPRAPLLMRVSRYTMK